MNLEKPPTVSGDDGGTGHLEELRVDPIGLMRRVRDECGDVGEFRLADRPVVLVSGAEANEWFFRAPEEDLDQAEAYPFMTPIFGEGVVFDAPPERRREMLHNQALRDKFMRGHAATIADEVDRMVGGWGGSGEIDLLDWFAELTIYTSSACLIGRKFRDQLDRRFAELYHDLERGTDAIAYVDPYADIESFHRRDAARAGLVDLVKEIMDSRATGPPPTDEDRDLLDVLMSIREDDGTPKFSPDYVTGAFISMMFAGHHTTSGTAAWTLIELLRHPAQLDAVVAELDALYAGGEEVSYQALREIPRLEAAIKETLRLRPVIPAIGRRLARPVVLNGYRLPAGINVSPAIYLLHRHPDIYPDPSAFRPERFLEQPPDGYQWIPFGGGTRRCIGASFAMLELRIVLSTIMRHARLTLVDKRPERIRPRVVVFVPARGVRVRLEAVQ